MCYLLLFYSKLDENNSTFEINSSAREIRESQSEISK